MNDRFISAGVDLVNKFKNAKDTYQKHKNKITCSMKSGAGAAQVGKITWPHFMQMMEIMEPVSPNPMYVAMPLMKSMLIL